MIIFGTGRNLVSRCESNFDCNYCRSVKTVGLEFYVRYFHIFWIPMFTYGRYTTSYCAHCRQVLTKKEMDPDLSQQIAVKRPRIPLKYFSGLFLGLALILLIIVAIVNENMQTKNYLARPKVGDIYGVKQQNGYFTLYLVNKVMPDSLAFRINNYEVPTSSKLSAIRRDHADDYDESLLFLSKAELNNLLERHDIVNIKRE